MKMKKKEIILGHQPIYPANSDNSGPVARRRKKKVQGIGYFHGDLADGSHIEDHKKEPKKQTKKKQGTIAEAPSTKREKLLMVFTCQGVTTGVETCPLTLFTVNMIGRELRDWDRNREYVADWVNTEFMRLEAGGVKVLDSKNKHRWAMIVNDPDDCRLVKVKGGSENWDIRPESHGMILPEEEVMKYKGNDKWEKIPKKKKAEPTCKEDENGCVSCTHLIDLERDISEINESITKIQYRLDKIEYPKKEEPKKEYKRLRSKKGNSYFTIEVGAWTHVRNDEGSNFDDNNYRMGNYYLTEEAACDARDRQLILQELKDIAVELNKGEKVDWNTDLYKYYITLQKLARSREEAKQGALAFGLFLNFGTSPWQAVGGVYCLSKDFLKVALERIGEERLLKLFE